MQPNSRILIIRDVHGRTFWREAVVTLVVSTVAIAHVIGDIPEEGTVTFESTQKPALNFTVPVSRAADIYRLMPESVATVCREEYAAVRGKSRRSAKFYHEGVKVQFSGEDPQLQVVFTVPGYRLTVRDVSWDRLDALFYTGI